MPEESTLRITGLPTVSGRADRERGSRRHLARLSLRNTHYPFGAVDSDDHSLPEPHGGVAHAHSGRNAVFPGDQVRMSGDGSAVTRESRDQAVASTQPATVEIRVPMGGLSYHSPSDVEGESMAKKWGISKILLAAAVVVFVLAAVGVGIGELDLIALGLALGFASFIV